MEFWSVNSLLSEWTKETHPSYDCLFLIIWASLEYRFVTMLSYLQCISCSFFSFSVVLCLVCMNTHDLHLLQYIALSVPVRVIKFQRSLHLLRYIALSVPVRVIKFQRSLHLLRYIALSVPVRVIKFQRSLRCEYQSRCQRLITKNYKGRSPNIMIYLEASGRNVDISRYLPSNLSASACLTVKTKVAVLYKKTTSTYEVCLTRLVESARQENNPSVLFRSDKRPFLPATIKTFMHIIKSWMTCHYKLCDDSPCCFGFSPLTHKICNNLLVYPHQLGRNCPACWAVLKFHTP